MDVRRHVIKNIHGQYWWVKRVDKEGRLLCEEIKSFSDVIKNVLKIDPLTEPVYIYPIEVTEQETLSNADIQAINVLGDLLPGTQIWRAAGCSSSDNTYLLILESIVGMKYIYYICPPHLYSIRMKGNYLLPPAQDFYEENTILGIPEFSQIQWVQQMELYRIKDKLSNEKLCHMMKRLFLCVPDGRFTRLYLLEEPLQDFKGNVITIIPDALEKQCMVTWEQSFRALLDSDRILSKLLTRCDISTFFKEVYDYPCAYFNKDELTKACDILRENGYGDVASQVIALNGQCSTYAVDADISIGIRDQENVSGYMFQKYRAVTVRSVLWRPLYYEIRMYPLCGDYKYQVVEQVLSKKTAQELINCPYTNLIRGAGIKINGFPHSLIKIEDSYLDVTIHYKKADGPKSYMASYSKEKDIWIEAVKEDMDFLSNILDMFNEIAGIKEIPKHRYMIYKVIDDKVVIGSDYLMYVAVSDLECKRQIECLDLDQCFVIHYIKDVVAERSMYDSKKMSLDEFMGHFIP